MKDQILEKSLISLDIAQMVQSCSEVRFFKICLQLSIMSAKEVHLLAEFQVLKKYNFQI